MTLFLSVKQVAEMYGKNEETVKRWLRSGKYPNAIKNSDKQGWKIPATDLAGDDPSSAVQEKPVPSLSEEETRELVKLAYQVATLTHPTEELVNILSFVGLKRMLELLLVMQQSPTKVKNPTSFLKKAISEGWTSDTIPQKMEKKQAVRKPIRKEAVPEWLDPSNELKEPTSNNGDSTDELLSRYSFLKSLYEDGNISAKKHLDAIRVELEKRGVMIG